jgi:hypothetical protein
MSDTIKKCEFCGYHYWESVGCPNNCSTNNKEKWKRPLFDVCPHSYSDIITNSSTELFCTVTGKNEETIIKVLQDILEEFGCDAVQFSVSKEDDDEGKYIEGAYQIYYDYEINHAPCKAIKKRIMECLEVIKSYE